MCSCSFVKVTERNFLFVFVRLANRTNINELPIERFTNCSLNVQFVYNPTTYNPINYVYESTA
ncbi:hypothetical protein Hanom_Chr03g00190441 [Helianthus anomalus]